MSVALSRLCSMLASSSPPEPSALCALPALSTISSPIAASDAPCGATRGSTRGPSARAAQNTPAQPSAIARLGAQLEAAGSSGAPCHARPFFQSSSHAGIVSAVQIDQSVQIAKNVPTVASARFQSGSPPSLRLRNDGSASRSVPWTTSPASVPQKMMSCQVTGNDPRSQNH